MPIDDDAKAAIDELYKSLSIVGIIGEPMEIGDKVIIPITKMGIVFGTGLRYRAQDSCPDRNAGGGAGIFPASVVVISKSVKGPEGIRVLPLPRQSGKIELAESLGQMASSVISRLNAGETSSKKEPMNDLNATRDKVGTRR